MLDRPTPSMRDRLAMYNANALKIGLFGFNCSSGRSATKVPERWSASWPDCLALARMADDRRHRLPAADRPLEGLRRRHRFARRVARDHHLGDRACSARPRASPCSAPCTRRCFIRSSPPSSASPPTTSARAASASTSSPAGTRASSRCSASTQRDHDVRYDYAQDWIEAIKLAWGPSDDFDFDGQFIKLKKVRAKPKPYGGTRPLIMNAGSTPAGQALRAAQLRCVSSRRPQASRQSVDATTQMVQGGQGRRASTRPRDRGLSRSAR